MRKVLILTLSLALLAGFTLSATAAAPNLSDTELTFDIDNLPGIQQNITYGESGEFQGEIDATLHVSNNRGGVIYSGTGIQRGTFKAWSGGVNELIKMKPDSEVEVSGSEEDLFAMAYDDVWSPMRVVSVIGATGADYAKLSDFTVETGRRSGIESERAIKYYRGSDEMVVGADDTGGDVTLLTGFWVQNRWNDLDTGNASLLSIESLTVEGEAGGPRAEGLQGFESCTLNCAWAGPDALWANNSSAYMSKKVKGTEATAATSFVIDDLEVTAGATFESNGYFSNIPEVSNP